MGVTQPSHVTDMLLLYLTATTAATEMERESLETRRQRRMQDHRLKIKAQKEVGTFKMFSLLLKICFIIEYNFIIQNSFNFNYMISED